MHKSVGSFVCVEERAGVRSFLEIKDHFVLKKNICLISVFVVLDYFAVLGCKALRS